MRFTPDVSDFVRINHTEIFRLTHSICTKLAVPAWTEDVVQDLYYLFFQKKALLNYNPQSGVPISCYLYPVIYHVVRVRKALGAGYIEVNKYNPTSDKSVYKSGLDPVEYALQNNAIHPDYVERIQGNYQTEAIDGLNHELGRFENYLDKNNQTYPINHRRDRKVKIKFTLLEVYRLMRVGYTNRKIAQKYNVSEMYISVIKKELKNKMKQFGFHPPMSNPM